jgi:Domain of unknown function (DUF4124)
MLLNQASQRYTEHMKLTHFFVALTTSCVTLCAVAQWQWIDATGRKVFSDRPPGAEVPEKNIIKQPNQRTTSNPAQASASPPAGAVAALASTKPDDGVDKALLEKKKQKEAAEATKRKAEEDRAASAKADNCARARQAKNGVDSGSRLSRINENGEREFYDDAARASESQRIQGTIDSDCR